MIKLFAAWISVLFIALTSNIAFPMGFCKDIAPTDPPDKSFDDECTIIGLSETVAVDFWVNDIPEPILVAGLWFNYDPSMVNVVDVKVYDNNGLPGPWDPQYTANINEPGGPGTYMIAVGNLPAVPPDIDGDFIIARMEFEFIGAGDTTISIHHIP